MRFDDTQVEVAAFGDVATDVYTTSFHPPESDGKANKAKQAQSRVRSYMRAMSFRPIADAST
jgi:hypothetical protein